MVFGLPGGRYEKHNFPPSSLNGIGTKEEGERRRWIGVEEGEEEEEEERKERRGGGEGGREKRKGEREEEEEQAPSSTSSSPFRIFNSWYCAGGEGEHKTLPLANHLKT